MENNQTVKNEVTEHIRTLIEKASSINFQGKSFVHYDKINELVTRERVTTVLKSLKVNDGRRQLLEDFVFAGTGARRLFLILASTRLLDHLSTLQQQRFNDDALPIKIVHDGAKTVVISLNTHTRHEFFSQWDMNDRDLLSLKQWELLAPKFGDKSFHFSFDADHRLPYLEREERPASDGFFGEVFLTRIHKAHLAETQWHGTVTGDSVTIAVKKAKDHKELAQFFDQEADNLQKIKVYRSPHLIKPIAAYSIGNERCLIFPWADGGNLDNYWAKLKGLNPKGADTKKVTWFIMQFVGLCSALKELHTSETENCIHGDLKPENILLFNQDGSQAILQIADLGLAAFHVEANTNMRVASGVRSGTSRYMPPEMDQHGGEKSRGRAYDIWSMGCILLELLVWFTSGYDALTRFKQRTSNYFWTKPVRDYIIHPDVESYMRLAEQKLESDSSFKDILELIRTKLLVNKANRIIARELHSKLEKIGCKCQNSPSYTASATFTYPDTKIDNRKTPPPTALISPNLEVPGQQSVVGTLPGPNLNDAATDERLEIVVVRPPDELNPGSGGTMNREMQSNSLHDPWQSTPDDDFARSFFEKVGWDRVKPEDHAGSPKLCSHCSTIDSSAELLPRDCDLSELQSSSFTCELCELLLDRLREAGVQPPRRITLRHTGAHIGIEGGPDLLSIYADPGSSLQQKAPLGIPRLLEPASPEHFTLLQQWLQMCDSTHSMCRRGYQEGPSNMPTRLLDVGHPLRLIDSASITADRYTALSHCWGITSQRFCTLQNNINQLKESIDFEKIPQTFQDAIIVTRGLGIKYIWIDSICIIQDDSEDWYREAAKMELVFSGAYCTLGASSSKSSVEGFLARDPPRRCLQLSVSNTCTLFVCPAIDDFHRDVELGPLNRRGWVLQERALSRRSIHYTSTQVYWECGAGVHCETLTRLRNAKAGFLGDANFPKFALEYYRDGRQLLMQDLFERYSELAFTQPTDRSVALLGLQKRMAQAFRTQGAYGIFSAYFARGLLWGRAGDPHQRMEPIVWAPGHHVPSWSWLSKLGAIKYMKLDFKKIEWATGDFKNPLVHGSPAWNGQKEENGVLPGLARPLLLVEVCHLVITFDVRDDYDFEKLRCVVVGRDKMDTWTDDQKHYALIIYPRSDINGLVYERVGVATLKASHIGDGESWVNIR
ncbi:hypothetical protein TruAng_004776 [Truncatella angustata]|nr:hypothetical protein TruAng_004776 [Truncatella angustata]